MAAFVPAINNPFTGTTFIPATDDAVGLVGAMNSHNYATDNHYAKDYGSADAVILSPVADPGRQGGPTDWQLSMRRNTAGDLLVGIEPMGTLTAVGALDSAPTGVSAAWVETSMSAARIAAAWGADTDYHLWKLDDVMGIWIGNDAAAPTYYEDGCLMIGKVARPFHPNTAGVINSAKAGRSGLGILLGEPGVPGQSNIINGWMGSATTCLSRVVSWIEYTAGGVADNVEWAQPGAGTAPEQSASGNSLVIPPDYNCVIESEAGNFSNGITYGSYPYIKFMQVTAAPLSVTPEAGAGTQGWLHLANTAGNTQLAVPWDRTVATR